MKKIHTLTGIAALATLSLTTATQGAAIYSQDFTSAVTSAGTGGAQLYGAGNAVEDQGFGFGAHSSGGQDTVFTTGETTGEMQISAFAPPSTANRFFASATALYLDTDSWTAGDYTVTFDVTDYVQGADDSHFGVYEGNNDGTLKLRVNSGNAASNVYPQEDGSAGTVSFAEIGLGKQITGVATFSISYDFTLTEAGTAGDYLVLGWGTRSANGGSGGVVSDSFNVDNITIVPEPGTYALLGGLLALGYVMVRRRR